MELTFVLVPYPFYGDTAIECVPSTPDVQIQIYKAQWRNERANVCFLFPVVGGLMVLGSDCCKSRIGSWKVRNAQSTHYPLPYQRNQIPINNPAPKSFC